DLSLFKITESVEEAATEIFRFYSNYHSMRYVGDKLVIRLKRPVDKSQLTYLNSKFKDILTNGAYEKSAALDEEANQPDLRNMPRLVFPFNRMNNGRLRQLIDFMNKS